MKRLFFTKIWITSSSLFQRLKTLCRPAYIARLARGFVGYETCIVELWIISLFNPLLSEESVATFQQLLLLMKILIIVLYIEANISS